MNAPLYNIEILRLAASVPFAARLDAPMASVEKRSRLCGSQVVVDVDLDATGRVSAVGMAVRACAFGQASAALLGAHLVGRSAAELTEARDQLAAWLAGARAAPEWPGMGKLAAALPHSARHAAIRLPFEAAAEAAAEAAR